MAQDFPPRAFGFLPRWSFYADPSGATRTPITADLMAWLGPLPAAGPGPGPGSPGGGAWAFGGPSPTASVHPGAIHPNFAPSVGQAGYPAGVFPGPGAAAGTQQYTSAHALPPHGVQPAGPGQWRPPGPQAKAKAEPPEDDPKEIARSGEAVPAFQAMTTEQKVQLISSLRSAWRAGRPRPRRAWATAELSALLREQEALLRSTPHEWTTGIIQTAFGRSYDMLQVGPSGWPHLHEAILMMADFVYRKLRPALRKVGMPDSLAALVELDQALSDAAGSSGSPLFEGFARNWYVLCFSPDRRGATAAVSRRVWARMGGPAPSLVTTSMSYLHHLALPPLERRRCSGPRTVAFALALLSTLLEADAETRQRYGRAAGQRARTPSRAVWVLGASDAVEGPLAQNGYFEDAGALEAGGKLQLFLVSDERLQGEWPCGSSVRVHARTREAEWFSEALPEPKLVFCMNTGLGTLGAPVVARWAPCLLGLLLASVPTVLTCRCQAEVRGERALLKVLGAKLFMLTSAPKHIRNLYSGMAADPDIEYDDNGWLLAFNGSSLSEPALRELAGNPEKLVKEASRILESEAEGGQSEGGGGRTPAVFWGILDLKYDAGKTPDARVRILESGDGRSSRFSGYGAAIKETVQHDLKLGETLLRRSILVENKKLTHDLIVDSGYGHVRPIQVAFPRVYSPGLASRIRAALSLEDEGYCVLKLCNRQRGAGVIPIRVAELEEALEQLLVLPEDVEAWLRRQPKDWARHVCWGSFEEQLRHWWSNECPVFVVEELCCSQPTVIQPGAGGCNKGSEADERGRPREFDGTMRVGFSLLKDEELETDVVARSGSDDEEAAKALKARARAKRPRRLAMFGDFDGLRVQWLGGYWKLPIEDTESGDLRGRVVSVAKQGTAPVPPSELHDVYATLGDVVQAMFGCHDLSYRGLVSRYKDQPELGAFIVARLALSAKPREKDARLRLLGVAQTELKKCSGLPCSFVQSYVDRSFGVSEAMFGNWEAARPMFKRSLHSMPANSTARFLLGMCLMESGSQGDLQAAVARMEESLLLDPDFKAPYADIGVAHLRLGDYDAAVEISEVGLARHPATAHLEYNLACSKFVLACREEEAAKQRGEAAHVAAGLRRRALEAFRAAREHRGKEQQWTERDQEMVEQLHRESRPLSWPASLMPRDGWRFLSWRQ
uniref:Uncharacterized protein n=1 Tax=Alexandrium monilatum TaxID=311494 RepID=A0A7S4VIS4_9DINO